MTFSLTAVPYTHITKHENTDMRKIEENMLHALRNERNLYHGNTVVSRDELGVLRVYLHGNLIAALGPDSLSVTLAGRDTLTTRSRLNAITYAFARYWVHRHKGQTTITPSSAAVGSPLGIAPIPMNADTWYTLPRWDAPTDGR